MQDIAAQLEALDSALAAAVSDVFGSDGAVAASDDVLLSILGLAARIGRRAEALQIEAAAHVEYRSNGPIREERLAARFGCRSASELVQRVTRVSSRTAADLLKAGRAIIRSVAPSSGEVLPSDYPGMRGALASGHVGADGLLAVVGPLAQVAMVAGRAAQLAADEELAAAARGEGVDAAPPACADDLRALASVWAMYLDQDGAELRGAAMRKRGVALGACRDGLVPLRGSLLPEVAGQLQLVFDSILNPKVDDRGPAFRELDSDAECEAARNAVADDRTHTQKLHDAFATALFTVAGSGALPTLGGAAPTLVVSVRAEDIESGRGFAHIDGCAEPVSLTFARQIACCGGIQRVVSDRGGRILSIDSPDRVFTPHQRRAIALRDGGCIIPGCGVRAAWCELHHVHEHSRGGPTHTDNGVMLCWHHHRTIESSGWKIRMNRGVPEVRGPYWWDASMTWRAVTKSPTRMRDRLAGRPR